MRVFIAEGIVLRRRNSGEADRILTVFTRQHGKMIVKAVGVRKISSKRSSHIEPINHVVMTLYQGKGMAVLTDVVAIETFAILKENLQRIGFAYHLCELIDGLCPEGQENAAVFDLFKNVLCNLSTTKNLPEHIHAFEVALLTQLGYWSGSTAHVDTASFIERILERRLKTMRMLPQVFLEDIDRK